MADDKVWHSTNVAEVFPTHDDIVNWCTKAGSNRNGICIRATGKPRFWVKYGKDFLIQSEGRTQAYVAEIVNANPASVVRVPKVHLGFSRGRRGYIVMDFVQGTTFARRKSPKGNYYKDDIEAVAAAFRQLTNIKMPAGTAPGPVGGGLIGHDFFVDCLSALKYPTVGHLEAQINEVLRLLGNGLHVSFQLETADGLVLCPSDPHDSNFMIDQESKLRLCAGRGTSPQLSIICQPPSDEGSFGSAGHFQRQHLGCSYQAPSSWLYQAQRWADFVGGVRTWTVIVFARDE